MKRWQIAAALLLCGGGWSAGAAAQAPAREVSVDQIVQQLAPPAVTTRGLRNLVPERRQIDLVIHFDFDSARLQPGSRPQLENLAAAMNNPRLQALRFQVQGHTDAKGSARHNDALSARRAQVVAELLQAGGVGAERLQAEGRGAADLLNKDQPDAAENRRVRIVALEAAP